ncbi:DUF2142 domain-containing protein [Agromyces aurantiacus]|uniref:DUF2142 domain-containing protein n=1 Tax=Agromyces aurantiacus TaxID=165814 RepID=A0ABV9R5S2_9MICO|nr:DUF2142 domain-containing protein [Agromyces aurantiacus]MBM7504173.1 hypothetical protein [Agromyces aurantiacus]
MGGTAAVEDRVIPRARGLASSRSVVWVAFAFFAILSSLWALASPVFSVPDENAHVARAVALMHGQIVGESVEGRKHPVVRMPEGYDYHDGIMCFVGEPQHSAECGIDFGDGTGSRTVETWVAAYNPIYYAIVAWPSLLTDDATAAVYAMRILSGLLCSVLLAWAFQLALAPPGARWMPLGAAFLATPMVVYFAGSVNPNGVEIAAGAALWMGALRLLERFADPPRPDRPPRWYLWTVVTVAAVLLANARAIGPLWVLVIAVACVAAVGWRSAGRMFATRASYPWLAVVAAASIFSVGWTLGTGGAASQADTTDAPFVGASPLVGVVAMLRRTGIWAQQAMGDFGWLDTPLPTETYWLLVAPLGALVLLAVTGGDRRGVLVVVGALAIAVLVPALVQGIQISRTGLIWQGRYGLLLFLAVPLAAGWALSRPSGNRLAFLAPRFTWVGGMLLWAYAAYAFVWVMRRFTSGVPDPVDGSTSGAAWAPPLGAVALCVLYALATLAFALWVGRLGTLVARSDATGARHG